jgi:hypothetical protein
MKCPKREENGNLKDKKSPDYRIIRAATIKVCNNYK